MVGLEGVCYITDLNSFFLWLYDTIFLLSEENFISKTGDLPVLQANFILSWKCFSTPTNSGLQTSNNILHVANMIQTGHESCTQLHIVDRSLYAHIDASISGKSNSLLNLKRCFRQRIMIYGHENYPFTTSMTIHSLMNRTAVQVTSRCTRHLEAIHYLTTEMIGSADPKGFKYER